MQIYSDKSIRLVKTERSLIKSIFQISVSKRVKVQSALLPKDTPKFPAATCGCNIQALKGLFCSLR